MGPLLQIRSIPTSYEMITNNARLEYEQPRPSYVLSRQRGGFQIENTPARIRMDTTELRASIGLKSVGRAVSEAADAGMSAALEAAGRYGDEGSMLMDSRNTSAIADIGAQRVSSTIETMLGFAPSAPTEISFDPHQLSIRYEADKLQFDWRTSNSINATFIPGSIEFKIKEYARLEIEYLGKPVYVPPSASPDFVPAPGFDLRA